LPHHPSRRTVNEAAALDEHRHLCAGLDLVVKRLDGVPEAAHVEHLAGHRVGAGQLGGAGAGLLGQPVGERHPGAVNELVGDDRGDQLAAQAMVADVLGEALGQRRGEVALEVAHQVRVLGQVGLDQL
jgi:hypothetical protein